MKAHLIAVASYAILVLVCAPARAAENVIVRTNTPLAAGAGGGAADTRYTGFLHSLAPTLPGTAYFEALKPKAFRTGVLTNISGGFVGDFQTYDRVRNAGATFEYILSDAVYVKPADQIEWPGGPKDPTYAKWDALVDNKIAAAKAAGGGTYGGRIDIWNEPDYDTYWPYQNADGAAQFFEAWKRAYAKVRVQLPGVEIVGPSLSLVRGVNGTDAAPWLPTNDTARNITIGTFLDYAKANSVLPDKFAVHVSDKDLIDTRVNGVKSALAARGITNVPVVMNEYVGQHEQTRPGVLPQYFARMQAAGVPYGIHATWPEPAPSGGNANFYNNSLDGLLTDGPNQQPRSTWWVYKRYSEMTGNLVQVDAGATVTGLASLNAVTDVATILLGRDFDDQGYLSAIPTSTPDTVTLQLDGIVASMGVATGTPLTVELQRIADSGYAAYVGPTSVFLPLVAGAGSLSVPLADFGWTDAYFVRVTVNTAAVPEPTSVAALAVAGATLLMRRKR